MGCETAPADRAQLADSAMEGSGFLRTDFAQIISWGCGQCVLKGGVVEVHRFNQSEWFLYELREAINATVIGVVLQSAVTYNGKETIFPPLEREGSVLPAQNPGWRDRVELPMEVKNHNLIECSR